jgi:signal transduction histidine kinase
LLLDGWMTDASDPSRARNAAKGELFAHSGKRAPLETWRDSTGARCEHHDLLSQEVLSAVGDLAAAVAHEAKNPLAGISGAMQILKEALPQEDPRCEVIDEVLKQVGRLDRLIRDLLAFAQPIAPSRGTLDLASLTGGVVGAYTAQARARGVRIELRAPSPAPAELDRSLVEIAIGHVLNNAVEAAPANGGHAWIECAATAAGARLTVEDDGPGIPPDSLCLVFKPFFTTKSKGTGLGLAIVKRVVDAHGGEIRVEPRPGGGTRVTLEFSKHGGRHGQG